MGVDGRPGRLLVCLSVGCKSAGIYVPISTSPIFTSASVLSRVQSTWFASIWKEGEQEKNPLLSKFDFLGPSAKLFCTMNNDDDDNKAQLVGGNKFWLSESHSAEREQGRRCFLGQTTPVFAGVLLCIKYIFCRSTAGTTFCTPTRTVYIDQGWDPGLPYLAPGHPVHPSRPVHKKTVHGMGAGGCEK